ncbi:uncharacterized protein B0H18DRAFT_960645 [Fomitopsis serialis]|uniref:uncharacterized protein n=1 Tax=Fomitopsis serialis TaxID=139415 RepID=UPI002008DADF|nr:uncharacterized protein B0H18DRAFT_960645 [Neoantrodia serialis]KAH9913034.1 hypothetical protein B0H18DRAFT_960645 [Neoantrodia serialis]
MSTPLPVDQALIAILAQHGPRFEEVCKHSRECTTFPAIDHVAVVCLEKDHLCVMRDDAACRMKPSRIQSTPRTTAYMLQCAKKLRRPPRFGGWVFMGALRKFWRESNRFHPTLSLLRPSDAWEQGRTALVEAQVYVMDGFLPVSIPLIGEIDTARSEIVIPGPFSQPLLCQVIRDLNYFKNTDDDAITNLDLYDPSQQTFNPSLTDPTFPIRLSLPLTTVPILKDSNVNMTILVIDHAAGRRGRTEPMCSMKHDFMELDWVWPVGLQDGREYLQGQWSVMQMPDPVGVVAVGPRPGQAGSQSRTGTKLQERQNVRRCSGAENVLKALLVSQTHPIRLKLLDDLQQIPPALYLFRSTMPTPRNVDERVIKTISEVMEFGFEYYCGSSSPCSRSPNIDHVTVICMERLHFGELYEYCLLGDDSGCPMRFSPVQIEPDKVERMMELTLKLRDPPARFGGWVYMGAIPDFYACASEREGEGRLASVEALFYVANGRTPISIPLIGEIDSTGMVIDIPGPSTQPLLIQAIPGLNRFKGSPHKPWATFDLYSPALQTFIPAYMNDPDEHPIRKLLPLDSIPVFKESEIQKTINVHDYTTGKERTAPMCSMKYAFMGLDIIWPEGLKNPRQYVEAAWSVVPPPPQSPRMATRPRPGEEGCVVRWGEQLIQKRGDNGGKNSEFDSHSGSGIEDEDEADSEPEDEPLWELDSDGY